MVVVLVMRIWVEEQSVRLAVQGVVHVLVLVWVLGRKVVKK